MYKKIIILLLSLSFAKLSAQNICLSFDDAPMNDGLRFSGIERTKILIETLKNANISPIIFCVPHNLDSTGNLRLNLYSEAGFTLGNHTYTHKHIEELGTKAYINDIIKADTALSKFGSYRKIFRYPYLDEGKTLQIRDSIRYILIEHGYEFGYVTVDTYDWYINSLYQTALKEGKIIDYEAMKEIYLEHVWSSISFYDGIAKEILGRSPNHVVLLHENDLAALYADELIEYLKTKGCNFISPEEAYSDKIARQGMSTLINNQGKIGAIAKDMGYSKSIWPETEEEDYIIELFKTKEVIR